LCNNTLLFQNEFIIRLIIVSLFQIWPVFYGSYFAYRLLKRAKNRSTYTMSGYFITTALTYFLATISTFFVNTPLSYILYVISIYVFVFSYSFAINFSWLLTRLDEKSCNTKFYLRTILYAILSLYVLLVAIPFNGITLNASTGWIPTYSWLFLGISWTYFLIFLIIPQIYLSFKILKVYEGVALKQRLNMFLISVLLVMVLAVFMLLYNTWTENVIFRTFYVISVLLVMVLAVFMLLYNTWTENVIFRTFYVFIMPELGVFAAYFVYKGFGKMLD